MAFHTWGTCLHNNAEATWFFALLVQILVKLCNWAHSQMSPSGEPVAFSFFKNMNPSWLLFHNSMFSKESCPTDNYPKRGLLALNTCSKKCSRKTFHCYFRMCFSWLYKCLLLNFTTNNNFVTTRLKHTTHTTHVRVTTNPIRELRLSKNTESAYKQTRAHDYIFHYRKFALIDL